MNSLPHYLTIYPDESSDSETFESSSLALVPSTSNLVPSVCVGKTVVDDQSNSVTTDKYVDTSDHVVVMDFSVVSAVVVCWTRYGSDGKVVVS
ncbi:hypothetical protein SUGI_0119260 [Cryptomeria japonica]|nr:hypothetical protein SUGI_0119260 [Cryptomeria japonica]